MIVLLVALACRALYLDARPFWVDEAESSINALTILERGYPTDAYLGIPIYENTLIQKWPESAEYEFRDVSYSRMHMAVYHGWLPLYAMAGAFAVAKVTPDQVNLSRTVQHNLDERKRRTRVARLPAVLFGLLFLGTVYAGGRLLYGRDAAWTALAIGAIYPYHISLSRQARYYSAQVTLTTACALSFWMLAKDCRWKHVYVAALTFTLLFYTHLLSFGAAGLVWLLLLPIIIRRHEDAVRKMVVFVLLVAGGTLPWVFASGFYLQQAHIPQAWPLLNLPGDLWRFPPVRAPSAVVGILIAMLTAWVASGKSRLPERVMAPIKRLGPIFLFLIVWAVCGYATFAAFVPAVSFDGSRLNLSYWGPSFLLASVSCAALTRIVTPRHSVLLSPAFLLLAFLVTGHAFGRTEWFGAGNWESRCDFIRSHRGHEDRRHHQNLCGAERSPDSVFLLRPTGAGHNASAEIVSGRVQGRHHLYRSPVCYRHWIAECCKHSNSSCPKGLHADSGSCRCTVYSAANVRLSRSNVEILGAQRTGGNWTHCQILPRNSWQHSANWFNDHFQTRLWN